MNKNLRVAICIPSHQEWPADFALALCDLLAYTYTYAPPKDFPARLSLGLINKRGSILPQLRQELIELALKKDFDYALFIDSDQTFPRDIIYRLLASDKRVVACNIATKSIPANTTARRDNGALGEVVYTDPESTGLEQVWRVGCGIMLINLKVFKALPKPWFKVEWAPSYNQFIGEDWYFCEQLEKIGTEIFIDHDLSKEIGHIGSYIYTHDVVGILATEAPKEAPVLTP